MRFLIILALKKTVVVLFSEKNIWTDFHVSIDKIGQKIKSYRFSCWGFAQNLQLGNEPQQAPNV